MAAEKSPPPVHRPVLLREVLQILELSPGLVVVDGTVGAGGHAAAIARRIAPSGRLIGLDRDAAMLAHAASALATIEGTSFWLFQRSYAELPEVLAELSLPAVDRVLLDLGLSSDQLADPGRGFSLTSAGPLDMRFDVRQGRPAAEWLAELTEEELTALFRDYGEEPHAARIARHLVERRRRAPIHTAADLVQAVEEALPARLVAHARKEPATRVFQALRIHTNQELHQLESALAVALPACVQPGGVAVVISFHSLEDRLVKQAFRDPRTWHNLTPKPLTASATEIRANPRSRTAKLRAARRIPAGDPTT